MDTTTRRTKRSPNEMPWLPPYRYECENGHAVHADHPVASCPCLVNGELCAADFYRSLGARRELVVA